MRKKVEWTLIAKKSLEFYCNRIAEDSLSNAKKVRKEIILTSKKLSKNSEIFQIDEYYSDNPGNIRRFIKWNYRIVYRVTEDKVTILNIYHSKVDPKSMIK